MHITIITCHDLSLVSDFWIKTFIFVRLDSLPTRVKTLMADPQEREREREIELGYSP